MNSFCLLFVGDPITCVYNLDNNSVEERYGVIVDGPDEENCYLVDFDTELNLEWVDRARLILR